jgi:hypothetical protein
MYVVHFAHNITTRTRGGIIILFIYAMHNPGAVSEVPYIQLCRFTRILADTALYTWKGVPPLLRTGVGESPAAINVLYKNDTRKVYITCSVIYILVLLHLVLTHCEGTLLILAMCIPGITVSGTFGTHCTYALPLHSILLHVFAFTWG